MNTYPPFIPLLLILLLISFAAFGWSEDCEKQYQDSIEDECKVMIARGIWKDCKDEDEGR